MKSYYRQLVIKSSAVAMLSKSGTAGSQTYDLTIAGTTS